MQFVGGVLVAVHAVLAAWSVMGLLEWFDVPTPWPSVSNPLLPRSILLAQWIAVLIAASVLIVGYAYRWRHTPVAMAVCYAAMATLCAVQNAVFLGQYLNMALEYVTYATILAVLFRTRYFCERFA